MAKKWNVDLTEWKKMQDKLEKICQVTYDDSLAYI